MTEQVQAVVKPGQDAGEAYKARQAAMDTIEKKSLEKPGCAAMSSRCFGGGKYHLYRFKKYTDVRLVWSPGKRHRVLRRRCG